MTIKCEATNCKFNSAAKSNQLGQCTHTGEVVFQVKHYENQEDTICGTFEYGDKPKDFYKN